MTNVSKKAKADLRDRPVEGSAPQGAALSIIPPDDSADGEFAFGITAKMIEAGVYAAREHCLGAPMRDLVHSVFVAMLLEIKKEEAGELLQRVLQDSCKLDEPRLSGKC